VRAECAAVLSGMLRLAARRRAGKLFSQLFSLRQSIRFGKAAHLSGIEDREVATPEGNSISEFMQSAAFPNRWTPASPSHSILSWPTSLKKTAIIG